VLEIIAEEKLAERAKRLGVLALERLAAIRHPLIAELRGAGLLLGVELTDGEAADRILYAALSRGLSFKVTMGNTLTLSPPITISETDLMLGLDIVESCIRAEPA